MSRSFENISIDDCFLSPAPAKDVSAVVCCKNRQENLLKALKSWLKIKEITEIIILDFGCDEPINLSINDNRIKLYRYESKYWHLSKAYNIAIQLATKPYILKLDCDYDLNQAFLLHNKIICGQTFIAGPQGHSTRGLMLVSRYDFFKVNGYNERIINWGGDDTDIYDRLKGIGLIEIKASKETVKHIPHPEKLRTKYVPNPNLNRRVTDQTNIRISKNNPWTVLDKMSSYYD